MDYIKGVFKRRVQTEIESYRDCADEEKKDTIHAQNKLMLDRIST